MRLEAAFLYAESVLKLLVRRGLVDEAEVLAMADEHDLLASRSASGEDHTNAAHQLRCTLLDLEPPPAVDPAVEHRAAAIRRQIVERTRLISESE